MAEAVAQYSDVPAGFTVYSDIPAGFSIAQPSLADRQATSKATFEANQPESHLGMNLSASTLWDELKKRMSPDIHGTIGPLGNETEVSMTPDIMMPGNLESPTPIQAVGNAWQRIKGLIPNTESAGQKFQQVMGAAKDVPLDTSEAENAVARAQELRQRGSSMPKVLNDFMKARKPGNFMGVPVDQPMTYAEGRDFASNAGALSVREATGMNVKMQAQVKTFAHAMADANREAAESVGMGDLYDQAMKEYRQAKNLEESVDIIKKYAVKAAIGTGLGIVGLKGAQKVIHALP